VHFPYDREPSAGNGSVYMGGNDADPTAHFWAIDGIGALGLPGVLADLGLLRAGLLDAGFGGPET